MKGTLYLIPVTLGTEDFLHVIPSGVINIIKEIRYFVVEDLRSARRFLRKIDNQFPIDDCNFIELNEHSKQSDIESIISEISLVKNIGLMSEAGVPCVADPGSPLIKLAHNKGIKVIPLTGPSSILLALMASGMNGQNFRFNGYLPIKGQERSTAILALEKEAKKGSSQIFIEAPYRNQKLLEEILSICSSETNLCIAVDITAPTEFIRSRKVKEWRNNIPSINKRPAIFIIG
ncbi:MAG: SAM-dependent methyltransferase [Bacteroidales bacterium]|nr:SAM-dependent methyltransferase [Bacteroidales bacterium]